MHERTLKKKLIIENNIQIILLVIHIHVRIHIRMYTLCSDVN